MPLLCYRSTISLFDVEEAGSHQLSQYSSIAVVCNKRKCGMSESSGLRSVNEVDEAMHPGVDLAAGPCRAKMTSTPRLSQKSPPRLL